MSEPTQIEFSASYVSASEAGDFVQILFAESDNDDADYLLLQTQFEFDQDYDFKFETKNGDWMANVSDSAATLSRDRLTIQGSEGDASMRLAIRFVASDETFIELRKIVKMMVQELATDI